MKIISLKSSLVYDITVSKSGENQMPCPECSHNRKSANKNKKVFSWNDEKKTGNCLHCGASFVEYKPFREIKEYKTPEYKNITDLSEKALEWFTGRMISQRTLNEMKIYSDICFIPQRNQKEDTICFPYFRAGKLINIKYRGAQKAFSFHKDCELVFYNYDAIEKFDEIIIVEGEMDCLTFIECGHPNVISVPNGGAGKNLEYLDSSIDLFEKKTILLATDNDLVGIGLRQELIRRFGAEKCKIINFNDCKDANEVLIKHGGLKLTECIKNAIEVPVNDIANLSNQFDEIQSMYLEGIKPGLSIGDNLDKFVTWETGRLLIVTGIPGHGKSDWVDFLVTKLNIKHGWKAGYFSPENWPLKYHYAKLSEKLTGVQFNSYKLPRHEFENSFDYIIDNFYFVYPEENISIENILEKAKYLVRKYGIKTFVIDPYNKLDHNQKNNETETKYISRFLDQLVNFAKINDVLFILVAHPTKIQKENKKFNIPTLYDIAGSANFYNKCDYGVTVYRHFGDKENPINEVDIVIQKVKFKQLGDGGNYKCKYNFNNGRYENYEIRPEDWDNNSYLKPQVFISETINKNDEFDLTPLTEIPF